jgi:hypothetical protein
MPLRRVQPEKITRCEAASSGCNGPKEGECMGLCPPRARAGAPYIAPMPVQFAGEEPTDFSGFDDAPSDDEQLFYAVCAFIVTLMAAIISAWYFF